LSRTENHKVTSSFNGFLFSLDYSFRLFHSLFWRFHSGKKKSLPLPPSWPTSHAGVDTWFVCVCVSLCAPWMCVYVNNFNKRKRKKQISIKMMWIIIFLAKKERKKMKQTKMAAVIFECVCANSIREKWCR
jgi:hypothetical protein